MGARGQDENPQYGTETEGGNIFTAKATLSHRVKTQNGFPGEGQR